MFWKNDTNFNEEPIKSDHSAYKIGVTKFL